MKMLMDVQTERLTERLEYKVAQNKVFAFFSGSATSPWLGEPRTQCFFKMGGER